MSFNFGPILKWVGNAAAKAGRYTVENPEKAAVLVDGALKVGNKIKGTKKEEVPSNQNVIEPETVEALYKQVKKNREDISENIAKDEHNRKTNEFKIDKLQSDNEAIKNHLVTIEQQVKTNQEEIDNLKSLLNETTASLKETMANCSDIKNEMLKYKKVVYISTGIGIVAVISSIIAIFL